jgi:uncharacterized protein YabE (DUF348 family)
MKKYFITIIILLFIFSGWNVGAFWFSKEEDKVPITKLVEVNENGNAFKTYSQTETIGDFLKEQKIKLSEDDFCFPQEQEELISGSKIIIRRALPISIEVDGKSIKRNTLAKTVSEAIGESGITLSHLDKIKPAKNSYLEKDSEIKITRIEIEEVDIKEKIKFKTVEKEDSDLKWRKKKVKQEGRNGTKEVKYKITYKNGKEVSRVKLSSKTKEEATPEIISIGTKIEVGKTKTGRASWYNHTGTLACASRMFPRGTWLRVTNKANGKKVFVQVNDYGPMRGTGKMIDLDKVAFKKIGDLGQGVMEVKVEEIID